ncbi:hypothetical protein [Lentzea sp.]|uniref:hypothetical protein n=1 Tax=Lentzea sp. TaxID=56099 RepID=UPI002ECFB049
MIRQRRLTAALAVVAAVFSLAVVPAATAAAPNLATIGAAGPHATRFGTSGPKALANVPDDQVKCGVDGWKPTWSPKPTVNFGLKMQCNGRWVRGVVHLYLYYRFSQSDTWTLAARNEFIPLPGGDSSTLVLQGLSHTLTPCFPAYWYGQIYVEATFYAGSPLTDWAWFGTSLPDPFLTC